jgi:hypothetical protein
MRRVAKSDLEGSLRVQVHAFSGQFAGFDAFCPPGLGRVPGCRNFFQ